MKKLTGFLFCYLILNVVAFSQVDTTYIYNKDTPFGTLDIRIAKSATNYYYLQEDQTFSFRESGPGVRTNTYLDMTSWDTSPYREGNLREKTDNGDNFVMNYRLLVPEGYNASFEEGYPIVMILHGFGERGNCEVDELCYHADRSYSPVTNDPPAPTDPNHELLNNDHHLLHGARQHLDAVNRAGSKLPGDETLDDRSFPGFVLFPQNLNGWDNFSAQEAIRVLRLIMKKYNINPDRVYVEGISNGGQGMYECIKRAPWLFASAIGMSAVSDGYINSQGVASRIAHIPLWLFQGGFDISPSPGKTQRYIQQFRNDGVHVRYTLYPELGHGTWNTAFKEPDFFAWMLGTNKADIHSYENSKVICSDEGTRLELAPGFPAYQWEFNGSVITDATEAVFYATQPGNYRARFSRVSNPAEGQWNQWSETLSLTITDPPQATIEQIGTVLLKDLNGMANARLQSAEPHGRYYWYKDGSLLDLPGQADDTLRLATIAPSYGNGAYTLVVVDHGCTSEPSAPKHVIFNDQAPISIAAPTNFAGFSTAPVENSLTWTDASDNEGGFEIWRRQLIDGSSYSEWQMVALTGANTTTFDDTGVEPTVSYRYKIRAVNSTARSEYNPSAAGEGLAVETAVDSEAPTAPLELSAVPEGIQQVFLSWRPATDNTRIREYYVFFNGNSVSTGSADTTFLLAGLDLNTHYEITVKGMDLSRNMSPPSNTKEISTYFSGLYYEHTTGSWSDLDSVDWTWSEFDGVVRAFTLSPKTQDDYYNFTFDGFIYIENGGDYQFRTGSSDGSRLWLDGNLLVDNDGLHGFETVTSQATALEDGPHRIYVRYFEHTGPDTLVVEYNGPDTGNEWTIVSRNVLKSDPNVITAIGPGADNGPEDSFIVNVFPNPTTQDKINVMVETVLPAPVRVRLLDPVGRNLFDGVFQAEEIARGIMLAPTGTVNTGMYVVMVEQGNARVRQKVIVKRQ